jgi:hypothetical protein
MFAVSRRRGFTLRDMVAVIALIGVALVLLPPIIYRPRINTMRNACINNMKQIVLAIHNYHDVFKKFPTVAGDCANLFDQRIGYGSGPNPDCTLAQYSWLVRILPYMEEPNLYNEIWTSSKRFKVAAFDPSLRVGLKNGNLHFSQITIPAILCPVSKGDAYSDNQSPADTYAQLQRKTDPVTGKIVGVALTNYVAVAATHKERLEPDGNVAPTPNGVIVPGKAMVADRIEDGLRNTIVLAETRETSNSSWYDSSGTWVVAILPRFDLPSNLNPIEFSIADQKRLQTSLNVGPTDQRPMGYGTGLPKSVIRRWGASSDHHGDVVIHAFADDAVRPISTDIDPEVYAALVTANGGERANPDNLK